MASIEKKEILQAVLMADNFNDHFKPFTSFNSPVNIENFQNIVKNVHTSFFFSVAFASCQCSAHKLCAGNA
jgi:chloramphenicol O-acetyltransferase